MQEEQKEQTRKRRSYVVVGVAFHTNPSSSSLRRRSGDKVSFFVRCTPTHCPSR